VIIVRPETDTLIPARGFPPVRVNLGPVVRELDVAAVPLFGPTR
jgi:hypothetical protein